MKQLLQEIRKNKLLLFILCCSLHSNGLLAQEISGDEKTYSEFYISLSGGWNSFNKIENEIEEAVINAGGIFFNNNTEELTEYSQKDNWSGNLTGGIFLTKNVFCELMVVYKPDFKGEFTSQDLQHDAIFAEFDYDFITIMGGPGYSDFLGDKMRWFTSVKAGCAMVDKSIKFYGMAFGRIGGMFDKSDIKQNSLCASYSIGIEYFLFSKTTLLAKVIGIKYFGNLNSMKSIDINAGIKMIL